MKRLPRKSFKAFTSLRLVRWALRDWDSARCWRAVIALQQRGSQVLDLARSLSASPNWRRRALGLYIASQLRRGSAECAIEETQALLLVGLLDARDEVVCAAVSGLGHRPHPSALSELVRLSVHTNNLIRWNVATTLGRYSTPAAIEALLQLASDADTDVRDWATFGLGTMHEDIDLPAIRDLLWRNLHDADPGVQGEALIGLANRADSRALDYLAQRLDDTCRVYELNAAERLASPLLAPGLRALAAQVDPGRAGSYWLGSLQAAIAACKERTGAAVLREDGPYL
jgi:HEAT repeat protein